MIFKPQQYSIPDVANIPFIDCAEIERIISVGEEPNMAILSEVLERSLNNERLSMEDTALLMRAKSEEAVSAILNAARELKKRVYGNRIVLFAPLYVGNSCINNCSYCGFRATNREQVRRTLTNDEIVREVEVLEDMGHKRLILVYGEHPRYDASYIADTVRVAYGVKRGNGEIRRININAAPLDVDGFRTVKEAGIGTYQIFQESYHPQAYKKYHLNGPKSNYEYRLTAMDRAMEAGIDDVGLGVLLGLSDWRFELLALIRHTNHLEACYNVGPHTISFPRIKNASSLNKTQIDEVSDDDFIRMVAILRLAVPYTGLILTARESAELRGRLIEFGVSQIDAGTHLEIGGYQSAAEKSTDRVSRSESSVAGSGDFEITISQSIASKLDVLGQGASGSEESAEAISEVATSEERLFEISAARGAADEGNTLEKSESQNIHKEQFELGDDRSLAEVVAELIERNQIPSFCTACYRKGRTGEHFMEFSTKGFIKKFCTPNAILTFAEYLEDYTTAELYARAQQLIQHEINLLEPAMRVQVEQRLERIKTGERDLLF